MRACGAAWHRERPPDGTGTNRAETFSGHAVYQQHRLMASRTMRSASPQLRGKFPQWVRLPKGNFSSAPAPSPT